MNEELMAFPQSEKIGDISNAYGGMTLRDYFAAKALPSVLTAYYKHGEDEGFEYMWQVGIAMDAYFIADAMLKAREQAKC